MGVLKYNSVRYGGGVDIQNTVSFARPDIPPNVPENPPEELIEEISESAEEEIVEEVQPRFSVEELLAQRETELILRERRAEELEKQLAALKEQYIEQGKEVILEAKRRAENLVQNAQNQAAEIVKDAETNREGVFIKARAEGFEQGKKDGVSALLAQGQSVLDEAKMFAERINSEKAELFAGYEKEIYETAMEIANKVTLDSMAVKDGTAAKKLIKKAAKEFRNAQLIRITLDENGASTELAGDYEYLRELCGGVPHVEVELIADAAPGTVIVDNGEEIIDAGINTQLKMIRELGDGKFKMPEKKTRSKKRSTAETAKKEVSEDSGED